MTFIPYPIEATTDNPIEKEMKVIDNDSNDRLNEVLVQLKIMNIHLEVITGDCLTHEDAKGR